MLDSFKFYKEVLRLKPDERTPVLMEWLREKDNPNYIYLVLNAHLQGRLPYSEAEIIAISIAILEPRREFEKNGRLFMSLLLFLPCFFISEALPYCTAFYFGMIIFIEIFPLHGQIYNYVRFTSHEVRYCLSDSVLNKRVTGLDRIAQWGLGVYLFCFVPVIGHMNFGQYYA